MKKLILSGALCLAVFAVAKFGYILDYRLADANPVSVSSVLAKKEKPDNCKGLKKAAKSRKKEKKVY